MPLIAMSALSLKLVCAKFSGCIAYFKIYVKEVLLLHALDQLTVYIIIPMYMNASFCMLNILSWLHLCINW
jgi:hypothetical protein